MNQGIRSGMPKSVQEKNTKTVIVKETMPKQPHHTPTKYINNGTNKTVRTVKVARKTHNRRTMSKNIVLLKGWSIFTKQRKKGKSKGNEDQYYASPTGKIFRSKPTMNVHIQMEMSVDQLCSNAPLPYHQKWTRVARGRWKKEGPLFQCYGPY